MAEKKSTDLIATLEELFVKAPNLPVNAREMLVKVAPWIALIFGILGVLAGLAAFGLSPLALFGGVGASGFLLLTGVLTIASSVLMLMAFPKLQTRQMGGWTLLFWSEVINVVASLLGGNIVGALIGAVIGFYLLFQVKSYYK
jgi:hypothetical protein